MNKYYLSLTLITLLILGGCKDNANEVVVYSTVDQVFSEPILKDFEHKRCIELARGKIHLVCKHTLHLVSEGKGKARKDLAG